MNRTSPDGVARDRLERLVRVLALAAVYFVAGKLGLGFRLAHGNATPVWAPTGISLAALLLFGRELWPGIAIGAFLVNATTPAPLLFSLAAASGNTATVVLAEGVIAMAGGVDGLQQFRQVVVLVIASFATPLVSATIGAGALTATGAVPGADFGYTWWVWWLGDSLGFLVVTPLLLGWAGARQVLPARRQGEALVLGVLLLAGAIGAFGSWNVGHVTGYPLAYAMLPLVVWAALRFGTRGATLATVIASGGALWGAARITGPLSRSMQADVLLLWQIYTAVVAMTSLALAGTAAERDEAEAALQRHSATLEQKVRERTNALREQSDQLVEFAHTVSHDLRAPIRAIRGYMDALAEELGGRLGAAGADYVARIGDATRRMDDLIQGLLAYSRLGNVELAHAPALLPEVVKDALTQIEAELAQRRAQVWVAFPDALPPVMAHRLTLVQAISNVVQNAGKFVPPARRPEITIWAEPGPDRLRLWIGDNGIGIRPEHHGRIFGVFERLHASEEFTGTGIGLALVKRSIERMGGAVGLESDVGQGSRFWIELRIASVEHPAVARELAPEEEQPA